MRILQRSSSLVLVALVGGCFNPDGGATTPATDTSSSGGVLPEPSTGEPPTGEPPTGEPPTGEPTTGEPTTGGSSTTGESSTTGDPVASTGGASTGDTTDATDTTDTTTGGTSRCGDGQLDPKETCDDGNQEAGDGCDPACARDGYFAFISSNAYPVSALGGLAGADALCAEMAAASTKLPLSVGTQWFAWLSGEGVNAGDRVKPSELPHLRTDFEVIATNTGDLLNLSPLMAPIDRDADGVHVPGGAVDCGDTGVWTGTLEWGASTTLHCETWTETTKNFGATTGKIGATDGTWTDYMACGCDATLRIYCFETPL